MGNMTSPSTTGSRSNTPTPSEVRTSGAATTPPRSLVHVRCPACRRKMNRHGRTSTFTCSGYPLCQVCTTVPGADLSQALLGSGGQELFFSPETRTYEPQMELPLSQSAPSPMDLSMGPMPQPMPGHLPPLFPQAVGPSMPTAVGVDLGGSMWDTLPCARSRRQSPPAPQPMLPAPQPSQLPPETPPQPPKPAPTQRDKEATEFARRLHQRQTDEHEMAYHRALMDGCPKCNRSDRMSRKDSSHLIHNLRCERCGIRIGFKRVG